MHQAGTATAQPQGDGAIAAQTAPLAERPQVAWDDIIGLEKAKRALHEAVVLPSLRADLFQVQPLFQRRVTCASSSGRQVADRFTGPPN